MNKKTETLFEKEPEIAFADDELEIATEVVKSMNELEKELDEAKKNCISLVRKYQVNPDNPEADLLIEWANEVSRLRKKIMERL